jgi:hypothetical protein
MQATLTTAVTQEEGMNATGLPIPADAIAALDSGKRPKVKVSKELSKISQIKQIEDKNLRNL